MAIGNSTPAAFEKNPGVRYHYFGPRAALLSCGVLDRGMLAKKFNVHGYLKTTDEFGEEVSIWRRPRGMFEVVKYPMPRDHRGERAIKLAVGAQVAQILRRIAKIESWRNRPANGARP